jgi:hypothetical protein
MTEPFTDIAVAMIVAHGWRVTVESLSDRWVVRADCADYPTPVRSVGDTLSEAIIILFNDIKPGGAVWLDLRHPE